MDRNVIGLSFKPDGSEPRPVTTGPGKYTDLFFAVKEGDARRARILLARGGDPNAAIPGKDDIRLPPLEQMMQLLLGGSCDAEPTGTGGTLIHAAAASGSLETVMLLVNKGADVNSLNEGNVTPLHMAAGKGHDRIVAALIRAGAELNVQAENGNTPLGFAVGEKHQKCVELLLEAGADVSKADKYQITPLMWASSAPIAEMLLVNGASIHAKDVKGMGVLHRAGANGFSDVVCVLFRAGANPKLANNDGKTAADLAREYKHEDTAKLLDLLVTRYKEKDTEISTEVTDMNFKMKELTTADKGSHDVTVEEEKKGPAESSDEVEQGADEQRLRVLKACYCCGALTHKRCGGCRVTFFCSRECQKVTYKEHKPKCLQLGMKNKAEQQEA